MLPIKNAIKHKQTQKQCKIAQIGMQYFVQNVEKKKLIKTEKLVLLC